MSKIGLWKSEIGRDALTGAEDLYSTSRDQPPRLASRSTPPLEGNLESPEVRSLDPAPVLQSPTATRLSCSVDGLSPIAKHSASRNVHNGSGLVPTLGKNTMTLHGVDVYIWNETTPDVPKEFGPFTLKLISNRGTRVYPGPAPEMDLMDWPRCRYLSDTEVSHEQIDELITHLSGLGWKWTKAQKLFQIDGVDAFSQPY